MKSAFIILFVLAFLPLTFACGSDGNGGGNGVLTANSNVVHDGEMMDNFYGANILMTLIYILVIISLVLFIIWMIRNLKRRNKK